MNSELHRQLHIVVFCDTQRYRSGHNEAVLKTVCPQGRVGSNPTLCAFFRPLEGVRKKIIKIKRNILTDENVHDNIIKLTARDGQPRTLITEQ